MKSSKPQFVGEKVKLGDLISKAKVERCGDRSFPVYSMTMHDGIVEQSGRFKKAIASKDRSSYKVVKKNQLVVGFPIDEGVIYVQNHERAGIMSPAYNVWDFDSSRITPAYLELALHSPQSMAYYAEKLRGTTARRRSLTADGLRALPIVLPSIERQSAVVEVLKGIKGQIADARKTTDELDHLVKSRFVEMFGDPDSNPHGLEVCPLGKVLSVQPSNGMYKPQKDYVSDGSGTPIIRIDSFRNEGPDYSSLKRLNCNESECRRYGINENDIIINRVNSVGCMGKTMLVSHIPEVTVFESNMMRLHSDEALMIPAFLCAQMTSEFSKSYFEANAKRAIGQASINQKDVKGLPVLVPTIGNQKAYLSFVAQVDKSRFAWRVHMQLRVLML